MGTTTSLSKYQGRRSGKVGIDVGMPLPNNRYKRAMSIQITRTRQTGVTQQLEHSTSKTIPFLNSFIFYYFSLYCYLFILSPFNTNELTHKEQWWKLSANKCKIELTKKKTHILLYISCRNRQAVSYYYRYNSTSYYWQIMKNQPNNS